MPTWRGNTYRFTVTLANATAGATYTNNLQTFTVTDTIAGQTTLYCFGTGAPLASGTLTLATGTGDATITFSANTGPNTNWGTPSNWLENAIPTTTTTAVFDAQSRDCTVNTNARACSDFTTTNYTNTITFTFDVQVNGNVTLGAGMLFAGTGFINIRFTANGQTRTLDVASGLTVPRLSYGTPAGGFTTTIISVTRNTTITNLSQVEGFNTSITINPASGSITIRINNGTFALGGSSRTLLGANTTIEFNGSCILSGGSVALAGGTIKTLSGSTLTVNNNWTYHNAANGTIDFSLGTVNFTTTTFTQNATTSINFPSSVGSFYDFSGGPFTTTLLSDVVVSRDLNGPANNIHTINGASFKLVVQRNLNLPNAQISGSATLSFESTTAAVINVTSVSGIINITNVIINKGVGTLTLNNTNPLTINSANYTLTSGTINHSSGTIAFSATPTQSITHTVPATYNIINIGGPNATKTLNGNSWTASQFNFITSQTFAGATGFTAGTFSVITAGVILTLANVNASPTAEYIVTSNLVIRGTEASRITLQSAGGTGNFTGTANGTTFTGTQANLAAGMTISQATGQAPAGLSVLFPARPVIVSGGPSTWVMDLNVTPSTGSITMRAGFKAKLTLQAGASQEVAFVTTQDIDSSAGQTIYAFLSNTDSAATNVNLFRTLNWGPLVAPSGSSFYTWVC
jgi:hypothetical protein